jgi:hypothetical protein
MTQVMFRKLNQILPYLFQMFPQGQEWRCVRIDGRVVYLSYGGRETRRLSQEHGPQVLMQPDLCFQMGKQEQSLLHVGLSWSEGPAWPFIAKSSKAGAVVIPFDQDEDYRLQDLVLIIPYGYLPSEKLQSWQNLLDRHHGQHGLRCMLNFVDSTHFWVKRMRAACLIAMVNFTIMNDIPLVVTLTAAQH